MLIGVFSYRQLINPEADWRLIWFVQVSLFEGLATIVRKEGNIF